MYRRDVVAGNMKMRLGVARDLWARRVTMRGEVIIGDDDAWLATLLSNVRPYCSVTAACYIG